MEKPSPVMEGLVIGPYEMTRQVGTGGFGEVWTARHREWPDRVHAFKFPSDARYVHRLRSEGNVLRALNHDNIVQIFDIDTSCEHPYIRMEYVDGESLAARLARGALPPAEAADILGKVLKGLRYAHEQGVIHRDLKPANILLGPDDTVKISDFGIAVEAAEISRRLDGSLDSSEEGTASTAGTLEYMAPEQKRGDPPSPGADIYSLGVVFYQMLAGRLPQSLKVPSHFAPEVPARYDRIVTRMLDPLNERYATAEEVLAHLAETAESEELPQSPSAALSAEEDAHSWNPGGEILYAMLVTGFFAGAFQFRAVAPVMAITILVVLGTLAFFARRLVSQPILGAFFWGGVATAVMGGRMHWTLFWLGLGSASMAAILWGVAAALKTAAPIDDLPGSSSE